MFFEDSIALRKPGLYVLKSTHQSSFLHIPLSAAFSIYDTSSKTTYSEELEYW